MIAIPASRASAGPLRRTSCPSMRMTPASGGCTPARIFTSVDLPAPFSPRRAWTTPARSAIDTSSSARIAPKLFVAPCRDSTGTCSGAALIRQSPAGESRVDPFEQLRRAGDRLEPFAGLVPELAVCGLVHRLLERGADDVARVLQRAELTERECLDEQVAHLGRLDEP